MRPDGCPKWCAHDESTGFVIGLDARPVSVDPGEHFRILADNGNDFIQVGNHPDAAAMVALWLGGNLPYDFPLRADSPAELRKLVRVVAEAADKLEEVTK